jgi:hypothetical protein
MHAAYRITREEALAEIADSPATLEFRAAARAPKSRIFRSAGGLIVSDPRTCLECASGGVRLEDVQAVYPAILPDVEVLADRAAYEVLRDAVEFERAIVHTLAAPWQSPPRTIAGLTIRPLTAGDPIDHLPDELRGEIERALADETVFAGFVDGVAVSFSYSASCTETWADISIDTIEAQRGRGIGAAVAARLIDDIVARGLAPVWGAVESNAASLALAAKLGFTNVAGELWVHEKG